MLSIASAQTYPAKPVKIIVPYAPGGPADSVARIVAPNLSRYWDQPAVVENRPGAAGNVGADVVAKSNPDGYTLMLSSNGPIVINVSLYAKMPFDPAKDLVPVTTIWSAPQLLVTGATLPVNSVSELVDYIRSRPGKLNYASPGSGTPPHLAAELFKFRAGLDVVHIPYKGGPGMTMAVLSGEAAFTVHGINVMPLARAGKLKALAVTSIKRSSLVPELPTIAESGFPGFEVDQWGGLFAPAGTPGEILAKLRDDVSKALSDPDTRARLAALGATPLSLSPEAFAAQIRTETAHWAQVIKTAGIQAQ